MLGPPKPLVRIRFGKKRPPSYILPPPPQLKTHIPLSMVSEAICAFLALSKSTSGYHPGSRRSRCYRRQGLHPPPCLSDVSRGNVTDRMRFEHQTRSTLVRTYGTNDTVQQSATGRCEQQTTEGFRTRGISNQRFSGFLYILFFFSFGIPSTILSEHLHHNLANHPVEQ